MATQALPSQVGRKPPVAETSITITTPTPLDLLRIAVTQNADIEKLSQLMELHERWERNEARKSYVVAINAFKADPPEIIKNETVSFTSKKDNRVITWDYATLDQICDAVIATLSQNGISHRWTFEQPSPDIIRVTCILTHQLGHSESTTLQGPPDTSGDKSPIHAVYSTVMHLQRYTLLAATGLATSDPSGEPASTSPSQKVAKTLLQEQCYKIANATDEAQLRKLFREAYSQSTDQSAQTTLITAKDKRLKELR